ncbi:MAG: BBP7 family outer membrane beta-barrel protein [Pirellulaceae bacterium]
MMKRHCGRRVWKFWVLVGIVALAAPGVPLLAAETFGYTSRKPQLWETERPVLEDEPGTNMYWHDPHLASWEACRIWPPATNGCPPSWYVRAEMLALYRDVNNEVDFASLGAGGPVALSTSDFRADFGAGVRAVVGKTLGDWYRLEVSYFGSYSWDDVAVVRNLDANDQNGTGNLYSPFSAFGASGGALGLDYNDFAAIEFSSRLDNTELNLRRRMLMRPGSYEASFLMGGRYLNIRDEFGYLTESSTLGPGLSTNQMAMETENSMLGVQAGLLGQFLFQPKCWIDFEMKGGIFTNRVSLDRTYTVSDAGGPAAEYFGSDERDRTSFVGDLSLQFNYQFARDWTFSAGYNALWITGIAIGAENFAASVPTLTSGPTIVEHSGEVVYHGPNIGLVFTH